MAVLYPDLSIDTTLHPDPLTGLPSRGHLTTSAANLRDRLGPGRHEIGPDRGEGWDLHTPAGITRLRPDVSVRDHAAEHEVLRRWLIFADSFDVLPWVYAAVHRSVSTFPAAAFPHFTEATLHGFGSAYLHYLYLRMEAETGRRDQLDRTAPDFLTHLRRPRQLNTMLLQLAEVLHDYEWAHASQAEREEWARMQRPTPSEGLRYWKARSRWLYGPPYSEFQARRGNPDLPGMLRALADTAREHRPLLREKAPVLDFALHAEHEQTLRALADIPIPGPDAIEFSRG